MTWSRIGAWTVDGFMFATIVWLLVRGRVLAWRDERGEARRLGGIDTRPTVRPITFRRDPSPIPRTRKQAS